MIGLTAERNVALGLSRRLWGGGNTSPLKATAWEANWRTKRVLK